MILVLMVGASAFTILSLYFSERIIENKKRKEVIKNEKN